jgi:hypothetical protein
MSQDAECMETSTSAVMAFPIRSTPCFSLFRLPSHQEKQQSYVRAMYFCLALFQIRLNNRAVSSKRISQWRSEFTWRGTTMASLLNKNDKNQSDRRIITNSTKQQDTYKVPPAIPLLSTSWIIGPPTRPW